MNMLNNTLNMKKIILIAVMALGFAVAAVAQPRALGARFGNGLELSYQHTMEENFVSIDGGLGLDFLNNSAVYAGATAVYNFMIAKPEWTAEGEWGFYAGPGAAVGLGLGSPSHFNLAAAGAVGLEYTFWFPLQLSIDFRQSLGYSFGVGKCFAPSSIGLGVRYRF